MSATLSAAVLAKRFHGAEGFPRVLDALAKQVLFQNDARIIQEIAKVSSVTPIEAGEVFIRQGDADSSLYFILMGTIVISPNGRDDIERSAGCHVGEMTAIDPTVKRSANVRAKESVVAVRISEADFTRIAASYPSLWRQLARELAQRLRDRVLKVPTRSVTPRLFIGSSSEGLKYASKLKTELSGDPFDVKLWTDGIFIPGHTNIEALEEEIQRSDFAALLLSPDDRVFSRWRLSSAPRDNLIFELGLFMGAITRKRALVLSPKRLKLPSDLNGLTHIRYNQSDLSSAATDIRSLIAKLGSR